MASWGQSLLFRILRWLIVTMHRKWRQIPHKFMSLHCVFIACIIMGKHTSDLTLMSKFRYGTVAFRSFLFLPHSPPIEV